MHKGYIPCWACGETVKVQGIPPLDFVVCPSCGERVLSPLMLDQFCLTRFLGKGSMGRVYQAEDTSLHREVAIKILREAFISSPRMWGQLEKEAKSAASVRSPRVVQIYRLGRFENRPYIVMELVNFPTLEHLMQARPVHQDEIKQIGLDVMEALKAAHRVGMVHGDIKPANIIVDLQGRAKVADFGLARFIQREQTVERWGTPYYMAPEKVKREREDYRSDLYSLGASLFHVMAGRAPFEGRTGEEVMKATVAGPTPRLIDFVPEVCPGLSAVIGRMMHADPDRRYDSYDDAMKALRFADVQAPQPRRAVHPVFERLKSFLWESPAERKAEIRTSKK